MKKVLGFIIIMLIALESCHHNDDGPSHFKIINASNRAIYYEFSYSYPDTSLNKIIDTPKYNEYNISKINANDVGYVRVGVFGISQITQMFVFDAYVVENEPWDSILIHNKVLKRYQLSVSDLKERNWTIKFP